MPIVDRNSDALILVTGATGFIAAHAVDILLKQGYRVRGTVRNTERGRYLENLFKDTGGERFEYVIVEDLEKDNGFDDAVKGVDGILHIASPLYRTNPDFWNGIINPAKKGTTNILYATLRVNPKVKRVVITSSYASIYNESKGPGAFFDENDWNTPIIDQALNRPETLLPFQAYSASKVWAEQAAWEFMEKEKPPFDITTILAPQVTGPIINPINTLGNLPTGNYDLWHYLTGSKAYPPDSAKSRPPMPLVDVRDVALAHVESLFHEGAGNKRIGVSNETHFYQESLDLIHSHPELAEKFPNANWGEPGARDAGPKYGMNGKLAETLLGIEYRDWRETILDGIRTLIQKSDEYGWDRTGVIPAA